MGKQSRRRSRRERERPERRRTAPPKLELSVVTYPQTHRGNNVSHDVELVRSTLLYADRVELISMHTEIIQMFLQFGFIDEAGIIDLLRAFDDETLAHFIPGGVTPDFRNQLEFMANLLRLPPGFNPDFDETLAEIRSTMAGFVGDFHEKAAEIFDESGLGELVPAIDAELLVLSPAGLNPESGSVDDSVDRWVAIVKRLLGDGSKRLLLDSGVADLVDSMIREGHVQLSPRGRQHADEATVASGLISRLPTFPQAPTDELLDLRDDLKAPLVRYRAAVARMARDINNPRASGLADEQDLDQLWLETVEPALLEIREGFAEHSLVREIARTVGRDLKSAISIGTGVCLGVGIEAVSSLSAWASAAGGAVAPAAGILASAATSSGEARRELEKHDLFFLYELEHRTSE